MIVTASDTVVRYVYPQHSGYRMVVDVDSMPTYMQIILENPGAIQAVYTFDNKRYSDYLYNFSHMYPTGGSFQFELVKQNDQITTWIDGVLATSAQETIYFPSGIDTIKIVNPSSDVTVDVSFYGESPTLNFLDIGTNDSVLYSGKIVNLSDRKTRLLGITGDSMNFSYDSYILAGGTGTYYFSGDLINSYSSLGFDFDFDFGKVSQTISVSDINYSAATGNSFLSFALGSSNIINDESGNFNLSYYSQAVQPLSIELEHISRIGSLYYYGSGSGNATGRYSGYINGEGYLESYALTGYVSGYLGSGYGRIYTYATGTVITDYTIEVVGYELGNLSTGYIQGYMTGEVYPGSGRYNFVGNLIGTPPISIWQGGINISPVGLYTGAYDFYKNAVGYFYVDSSGDMTMGASSSPIAMNGIENHFTLKTGEHGELLNDYTDNGWYAGNIFSNSPVSYPSGELIDIDGEVGYINGQYGVTDVALLIVSGAGQLYQTNIYGSLTDYNDSTRIFMGYAVREVSGSPQYKSIYYYPLTGITTEE